MSLSFLKSIKVEDTAPRRAGGGGKAKPWNPTLPNAIRVWSSGAVYPSQALAERFELEYGSREKKVNEAGKEYFVIADPGKGFDVFSSAESQQFKSEVPIIWISPVSKDAARVDLFGSTGYEDNGDPISSVMEQGAVTFGKAVLLPLIKEIYGLEPEKGGYIDMLLLGQDEEEAQVPFTLPEGKVRGYIPKRMARGEEKGELTYVTRQTPQVFVLYPWQLLHPEDYAADKAIDAAKDKHSGALVKDTSDDAVIKDSN